MIKKHGVQVRRTPPDILIASLKAWDEVAEEHSAKNPTFKKVYESQREYASKVVPAKRYMHPPYSFAANYYWPQEGAAGAAAKSDAAKASSARVGGWRKDETLRWPTNLDRAASNPAWSRSARRRATQGLRTIVALSKTSPRMSAPQLGAQRRRRAHLAAGQARAPGAHHSARDGGAEPQEPEIVNRGQGPIRIDALRVATQ